MKIKRILIIFIISLILMNTVVFADSPPAIYDNLVPDLGIGSGIGGAIISIVRSISIVAACVAGVVLGIKYVYSAPGDKAEVKKKMVPFIIGAVLIFGAASIMDVIYQVAQGI